MPFLPVFTQISQLKFSIYSIQHLTANPFSADDLNMKNSSFFTAQLGVLAVFFVITIGCASAPAEKNIWELLRTKDKNARGYFLGEVDVNATDDEGKTPLHYAAELNDAQLAGFFISIGANPNLLDLSRQSPLGISITNKNSGIAKMITASGADIHLPIKNNETAASLALKDGNSGIFKSILTPASIESFDSDGKTILHIASIAGNVQAVLDIMEISSAARLINQIDKHSKNALDYAFEKPDSKNHMEIAEILILSGGFSENSMFNYFGPAVRSANFNIRRNEGLAPIHYAVMYSHTGLISYLLEKKIDINIKTTSGATALHEAVRIGNFNIITMLVNAGADVNARDANNNTPLHTGIPAEVHKEVAELLLSKGADPNLRDDHGDTPLHIVIILNRPVEVIQSFIGGGSDIHIRNIQGKNPLYIAVEEGRTALIPILLQSGSEIFAADNSGVTPFDMAVKSSDNIFNMMISPETVIQRDSAGNTMLHAAVRNSANPVQIARILDTRAHVDARNREGDTALHIAVRMNQKESSEFLISRGASIFSVNSSGQSPLYIAFTVNGIREWIINPTTIISKDGLGNNMLHYAAEWKLNNVIPIILRNGLSVEEANATGETPLFMAVKTNSASTIRVLVDNKANINARDSQGNSVLHTAVRWNAKDVVEMLIAYKMDINIHSLNGNTPLHDAVIYRMADIEAILLKNGANLEVRNIDGNTPFMEAVRSGIVPSVERLSLALADISTRNIRGDTPLHVAVSTEKTDIVNTLLRMGASIHARNTRNRTPFQISLSISPAMVSTLLTTDRINTSDDFGNSAIHIALQEKAAENILRAIILKGARLNAVDSNGKTPLRLAVDMNSLESAKLIADSGADPFLSAVDNKTPAEIAFTKGNLCIRALFSGRAINARDSSGNTILHIAAHQSTPDIITLLLELGANKTIKNIASELPIDIALRWNRSDNAELLR